jgi:hypothetical protein
MVHLSHLPNPVSALDEATMTWHLPLELELLPFGLELILASVVILNRRDIGILRDVEVKVEVTSMRTHPRKRPAHAFLVRIDLGNRCTRDTDKRRVARSEMLEGGDVVCEEGARRTAGVPGGIEHEVVDDELAIGTEEVGQGDTRLFPGGIERSEGIRLGHFDDGQVAALGGEGVAGPGEILFLFKEGNASGAMLGGGGDLWKGD